MEWSGQKSFVASPELPFEVDGSEAGVLRSHGPLAFLKVSLSSSLSHPGLWHTFVKCTDIVAWCMDQQVHDAGHMVPMDQPKAALEMLKRWTQGKLSQGAAEPQKLVSDM